MKSFFRDLFSSWRGSTIQSIAAIVIPLTLLLVLVSFGSFFIHQNAMRTMVGERDERAVRAAAAIIQSEIQRRSDFIQRLTLSSTKNESEIIKEATLISETGSALFDFGQALFFADENLNILSGDPLFWSEIKPQAGLPLVSTQTVSGQLVLLISQASPDGSRFVVGAFSPDKLLRNILQVDFPENGNAAVYVFDSSFHVIFRSGAGTLESDPAHHPGIAEALAGRSGTTYVQSGNDEHVIAYSTIPATGWGIVIEESWAAVSTPTLQTTQITPLILIPALLLAMLALWFGAELIVKPLRLLEASATKLGKGDFHEIEKPVQGIAEIRHLQDEMIQMAHQVQAAQQILHNYIGAITRGQEDERLRLSRELHDDTIQSLVALKQRAQLSRRALPKEISMPALDELENLAEQAIQNLRRTIRALRPIYLEDFGLVSALEILAKETAQTSGVEIEFVKIGVERRFQPDVELALYRMVQETLNNTAQHAHATKGQVRVTFSPDTLIIETSDNGIGFSPPSNPAEFMPAGHFGLVGLYERAQLLGARLEIQSSIGQGTKVIISLQDNV